MTAAFTDPSRIPDSSSRGSLAGRPIEWRTQASTGPLAADRSKAEDFASTIGIVASPESMNVFSTTTFHVSRLGYAAGHEFRYEVSTANAEAAPLESPESLPQQRPSTPDSLDSLTTPDRPPAERADSNSADSPRHRSFPREFLRRSFALGSFAPAIARLIEVSSAHVDDSLPVGERSGRIDLSRAEQAEMPQLLQRVRRELSKVGTKHRVSALEAAARCGGLGMGVVSAIADTLVEDLKVDRLTPGEQGRTLAALALAKIGSDYFFKKIGQSITEHPSDYDPRDMVRVVAAFAEMRYYENVAFETKIFETAAKQVNYGRWRDFLPLRLEIAHSLASAASPLAPQVFRNVAEDLTRGTLHPDSYAYIAPRVYQLSRYLNVPAPTWARELTPVSSPNHHPSKGALKDKVEKSLREHGVKFEADIFLFGLKTDLLLLPTGGAPKAIALQTDQVEERWINNGNGWQINGSDRFTDKLRQLFGFSTLRITSADWQRRGNIDSLVLETLQERR